MQGPIDYSLNVQSPFEAALGGLQLGATVADLQAKQKNMALQQQATAMEIERQKILNQHIQGLNNNPNPTAQDYIRVANLLPEKEAESFRKNWDVLSKDEQQNTLLFGGQVLSAFNGGQHDVAIKQLRQKAESERNSGREDRARAYETYAQIAEISPESAQKNIGIMVASVPGGDKVLDSVIKAQKAPGEVRTVEATANQQAATAANTPQRLALENLKTASEIRNIDSQITDRAGRLSLDKDRLQSEIELKLFELGQNAGKLTPDAAKIVNDAAIESVSSEQSAGQMIDLASRIESAGGGKGALTKASEWFAKATGKEDSWSQLRREYVRIRNSSAIKSLPPGSSSDTDIQMVMKPFPDESADSKTLASFLRGMAKSQQLIAASKSAEAEWVNATGSLGRAKTDIDIGGIKVPAGSSFVDFMRQFGDKRAAALSAQQSNATFDDFLQRFRNKRTEAPEQQQSEVPINSGYIRAPNLQTGQVPAQ